MRFLFGLFLGAVLTLFVATAFDAPTHALVDKGKASWQDFLLATGDALFEFPELKEVTPDENVAAGEAPHVGATPGADIPSMTPAPTPEMAIEKAPDTTPVVTPVMTPVMDGRDMEADTDVHVSVEEPRDLQTLLAAEQTVWVPFRSQMSAQGFAKRLTGQLDHPFAVNREGPGRYQVSFDYESESQRLDVLGQVQSLTGQELP